MLVGRVLGLVGLGPSPCWTSPVKMGSLFGLFYVLWFLAGTMFFGSFFSFDKNEKHISLSHTLGSSSRPCPWASPTGSGQISKLGRYKLFSKYFDTERYK